MSRKSGQGILNLHLVTKPTSCKECGMNYYTYVPKDASVHARYHDFITNGPKCDFSSGGYKPCHRFRLAKGNRSVECRVYCIDKKSIRLIKRIESLLEIVNRDLNAPPENPSWKEKAAENGVAGHAFAATVDNKIVGLCVTDPITNIESQTRWIVERTQEVVPNQINKRCKVGISRIWVAAKWRRLGIAQQLLDTVLTCLVYGIILRKTEVAFSQPSHAGGKLARQFNGVQHKSGEILLPIYLE